MFTGIIEEVGVVHRITRNGDNLHLWVTASFYNELKVDQSIAHNGICLTVTKLDDPYYEVIAVKETLLKTNLGQLKKADKINLERCMKLNDRLDGHIVQGHVDSTAILSSIQKNKGSTHFTFKLSENAQFVVEKGSICINGTSLTTFDVTNDSFTVTIIPYTLEHTTFQFLEIGHKVNIEFDIIGKYVARMLSKDF